MFATSRKARRNALVLVFGVLLAVYPAAYLNQRQWHDESLAEMVLYDFSDRVAVVRLDTEEQARELSTWGRDEDAKTFRIGRTVFAHEGALETAASYIFAPAALVEMWIR